MNIIYCLLHLQNIVINGGTFHIHASEKKTEAPSKKPKRISVKDRLGPRVLIKDRLGPKPAKPVKQRSFKEGKKKEPKSDIRQQSLADRQARRNGKKDEQPRIAESALQKRIHSYQQH